MNEEVQFDRVADTYDEGLEQLLSRRRGKNGYRQWCVI